MKLRLKLTLLVLGLHIHAFAQGSKTEILLVGSDHLSQIYKEGNPHTDVFSGIRQKEISEFTTLVLRYKPDMVMVEKLPEQQLEIDSLYNLYLQGDLNLQNLENGRSEVYQLAFRIGKELQLPKVYCVNAPGGISQSILDNGENIELYKTKTLELRKVVGEKYVALQSGELSLKDYLIFLNQPVNYNKIYHLRYITPARVTNGTFKNPDEMVDTAFINPAYIGAELISVFKNRDYKIYSNIVTNQMRHKPKKILLLIGVAHVGSLRNILHDDPEFEVVTAKKYFKK
jgi:hypothetical protein